MSFQEHRALGVSAPGRNSRQPVRGLAAKRRSARMTIRTRLDIMYIYSYRYTYTCRHPYRYVQRCGGTGTGRGMGIGIGIGVGRGIRIPYTV